MATASAISFATVSIPNRDAKNEEKRWQERQGKGVSIPNRDAKNAKQEELMDEWKEKFQSLIGTLKTNFAGEGYASCSLFQSLIGTLKTEL